MVVKDRENQPEQMLGVEIVQMLRHGKSETQAYREVSYKVPPEKVKSQNYWTIWLMARLLAGDKLDEVELLFLAGYDAAIATDLGPLASGHCGSEPGSGTYGGCIATPWLAALKHGSETLKAAATRWLQFQLALCTVSEAPNGRCLLVGQRSAEKHMPVWFDMFLAVARGNNGRAERLRKETQLGRPEESGNNEDRSRAWDVEALIYHFDEQARQIGLTVPLGFAAFEVLRKLPFTLAVRYHWLHTMDGQIVAVWSDRGINCNTAPRLGAVWQSGRIDWLPPFGGKRVRRDDKAWCKLVGDRLEYDSIDNGPASIQIPAGTYRYTCSTDWVTRTVVIGSGQPVVQPPVKPQEPQAPAVDQVEQVTGEIVHWRSTRLDPVLYTNGTGGSRGLVVEGFVKPPALEGTHSVTIVRAGSKRRQLIWRTKNKRFVLAKQDAKGNWSEQVVDLKRTPDGFQFRLELEPDEAQDGTKFDIVLGSTDKQYAGAEYRSVRMLKR